MYVCMYVYMYIYIYIYTHIPTLPERPLVPPRDRRRTNNSRHLCRTYCNITYHKL